MHTSSDLEQVITTLKLVDTHEHLATEERWLGDESLDILQDLFAGYPSNDLRVAGATPEAVDRLLDGRAGDVERRFAAIQDAWEAVQFTGYGEAVRIMAREVYGLESLTAESIAAAQPKLDDLRKPGERLRVLREVAGLDHVQIDDFQWPCIPDLSGPDFFLYDISWVNFVIGEWQFDELQQETGLEVVTLDDLRAALTSLFERFAPCAIAVKTQHAYDRTLLWEERSDGDAAEALARVRAGGEIDEATRLTLGDWCLARGVELAIEHNLPFKIHTGHHAGTSSMPIDWVRPGQLCALLARYPEARFVLMHTAYPYSDELVSIAKHYPNVWVDLCWAWAIDPYSSADFVRRFLHAVPINKLFAFGGDTFGPTAALAYSIQARRGLLRALESEVAAGDLTEAQAIDVAHRLMRDNQYACFDIEGTRAAIGAQLAATAR